MDVFLHTYTVVIFLSNVASAVASDLVAYMLGRGLVIAIHRNIPI